VFIEYYFLYYPNLQPPSRVTKEELRTQNSIIAEICSQLFNAYFNSSNANVLHTSMNVIVARSAALVQGGLVPSKSNFDCRVNSMVSKS
jgi:hypothetical protein